MFLILIMKRYYRKYLHIVATSPFILLILFIDTYIPRTFFIIVSLFLILVSILFDFVRLKIINKDSLLLKIINKVLKEKEITSFNASIYLPFALLILVIFFSRPVVIISSLLAAYADPVAALVGLKFGKYKNQYGKTIIGSIAFFLTSLFFIFIVSYILPINLNFIDILITGMLVTLAERYIRILDDNFIIPLTTALILQYLVGV